MIIWLILMVASMLLYASEDDQEHDKGERHF